LPSYGWRSTKKHAASASPKMRKRRHLTQQTMAEKLKIGYRTYQTWESGTLPEWDNLVKLARFFKVRPEDIIGDEQVPASSSTDGAGQFDRIESRLQALLDHFKIPWPAPVTDPGDELERALGDDDEPGEQPKRDTA
jgi:DNA-binding XRE family transcriptional regulator